MPPGDNSRAELLEQMRRQLEDFQGRMEALEEELEEELAEAAVDAAIDRHIDRYLDTDADPYTDPNGDPFAEPDEPPQSEGNSPQDEGLAHDEMDSPSLVAWAQEAILSEDPDEVAEARRILERLNTLRRPRGQHAGQDPEAPTGRFGAIRHNMEHADDERPAERVGSVQSGVRLGRLVEQAEAKDSPSETELRAMHDRMLEFKRLKEAATQGPWRLTKGSGTEENPTFIHGPDFFRYSVHKDSFVKITDEKIHANGEFLVHAHECEIENDLAKALKEIDRLRFFAKKNGFKV